MIPYGKQEITQEDIDQVIKVLKSDFITQGLKVPEFEAAVSRYCGAKHGLAVNSGTSALHIACLALGVGKDDVVWTSPITFVASANCARYCGAEVDFVDIDPMTYNLCADTLEEKLKLANKNGCLPKVVIPVHLCGQSCDMKRIRELADVYGFSIIEDACHAIGGKYEDLPVGCCQYSDITVFSFHPVKIITTAEGGMAVTNNDQLAAKMELLRSHSITRDPEKLHGDSHGPWYYQQLGLGFNYRLTDLQAALGLSQLQRIDTYVDLRQQIAGEYDQLLSGLPVNLPFRFSKSYSSFHLYVVRLRLDELTRSKLQIFSALRSAGVGVHVHYIPVHTQPYYQRCGFVAGTFPEAERYYNEALSLPVFPTLSKEEQQYVAASLSDILQ